MTIKVLEWQLNYIDEGAGETVLFLHGWAAPISLYRPIFDWLLRRGYRVVAFDMPGVGDSPEPCRPLTMGDYVSMTLDLCSQLSLDRVILFAHSHGGRIALPLLATGNCAIRCPKAILMDCQGIRPRPSLGKRIGQIGYKMGKVLGTFSLTRPLFGSWYEEMRDKRASADYKAATPVMRRTMVNVLPADYTQVMHKIKIPVLLIWGEYDTATPPDLGKVMDRLIPNAGLALIKGAGHFPFAENPRQFYAVLDAFL